MNVAEALTYAVALAGFGFVLIAALRMAHDLVALACIPPVFVSLVMGFTMGIYAWDAFGEVASVLPLAAGGGGAWYLAGRYGSRDLLICVYLAWAAGMAAAVFAFQFPDAV